MKLKRLLVLVGPTGCGKSATVEAIARELEITIVSDDVPGEFVISRKITVLHHVPERICGPTISILSDDLVPPLPPGTPVIKFNPVAPTLLKKALMPYHLPKETIDRFIESANGDIRAALNLLPFLSDNPASTKDPFDNLFHALGKILYAKQPLPEFENDSLLLLYLQENYLDFVQFDECDYLSDCASISDMQRSSTVFSRALMYCRDPPATRSFHAFRKPLFFTATKQQNAPTSVFPIPMAQEEGMNEDIEEYSD